MAIDNLLFNSHTAGVNGEIVYRNNTNDYATTRRNFLKNLGTELTREHQDRRQQNQRLPKELRGQPHANLVANPNATPKRRRCEFCSRNSDRKSQYFCVMCKKTICLPHANFMCNECINKNE